jgi:hypothetical protein
MVWIVACADIVYKLYYNSANMLYIELVPKPIGVLKQALFDS